MSNAHRAMPLTPAYLRSEVEGNASAATSLSVWLGAGLLIAICTVPMFDFTRGTLEHQFELDWQLLLRLGICAGCGLYGAYYLSETVGYLVRLPGALCPIFGLWAVVTLPWAIEFFYSAGACFALLCIIVFAPAAVVQLGQRRVVYTILTATLGYAFVSWFLYLAMPQYGRTAFKMLDEITTIYRLGGDAQQLGFQCAWAIGMMLILGAGKIVRWRWLWPLIAFCLVTLALSQSRTAMLAAAAVIALVAWRNTSKLLVAATGLFAVCLACVALFAVAEGWVTLESDALLSKVSRSGDPAEIYNLTGRTEIWPYPVKKISESPYFGYGYGGSRHALREYRGSSYEEFALHHAHNTLLNVALGGGLIAAALFLLMVLSQIAGLLRRPDLFPDIALAIVVVAGLTESVLFGPMPRSHTVIWLIALFWRQVGAAAGRDSRPLPLEGNM